MHRSESRAASALASLAIMLALGGCRDEPASAPAAAPSEDRDREVDRDRDRDAAPAEQPTSAAVPRVPGVQPDGSVISAVAWFSGSLEQALVAAATEHKLVLVDVGAYWCPPCQRLDEEVFVVPEVGERIGASFVALHIDADMEDGAEIVERYKVQAYPTILVLEPSGIEKDRMVDFHPADALLAALDTIAKGGNVLADREQAVAANPDDAAARYALANAYLLAARFDDARPHLDALLVADPKNELGFASKVLSDRAMFEIYKGRRDLPGALAAYRELQERFPDSREATRAYRQIGRILHELDRDDEAIASLDAMIATDPDDVDLKSSYGWFSFREKCKPAKGLAVVDAAIEKAPDNAELHWLRAELLALTGDPREAFAAITTAAKLEPKSAFLRRQVERFGTLAGLR